MPVSAICHTQPQRISDDHEKELRRYMTIGPVGEKSAMGPMLDRARLFSIHARPCTTCGGDVAKQRAGRGFVWAGGRGPEYKRALEHERAVAKFLGLDPVIDLDPGLYGETCGECDGRGWVIDNRRGHKPKEPKPLPGEVQWARGAYHQTCTAYPIGSSQEPSTSRDEVADHETLALIGAVSRRLLAIGDAHGAVLRAYYLPTEVRESPRAVWPLVPAGRTLLRATAPGIGPWQAIETLLQEQAERPTATRRKQFEAANAQAEKLIAAAVNAWCSVVSKDVEARVRAMLQVVR